MQGCFSRASEIRIATWCKWIFPSTQTWALQYSSTGRNKKEREACKSTERESEQTDGEQANFTHRNPPGTEIKPRKATSLTTFLLGFHALRHRSKHGFLDDLYLSPVHSRREAGRMVGLILYGYDQEHTGSGISYQSGYTAHTTGHYNKAPHRDSVSNKWSPRVVPLISMLVETLGGYSDVAGAALLIPVHSYQWPRGLRVVGGRWMVGGWGLPSCFNVAVIELLACKCVEWMNAVESKCCPPPPADCQTLITLLCPIRQTHLLSKSTSCCPHCTHPPTSSAL